MNRSDMLTKSITKVLVLFILLVSGCRSGNFEYNQTRNRLEKYNVTWNSQSKDYNGSMPIGNGDIGLNVWVEESGDICFFIGKTDSWGDNGRLLKVGKVRVECKPSILFSGSGSGFRQELDLFSGTIIITSSARDENTPVSFKLQLWVDANNPVIQLSYKCSIPVSLTATIEPWRTEPYFLPELNTSDLLEDPSKPGSLYEPVIVEPDSIIKGLTGYIGWYHHNKKSAGFDFTNKLQGLSEYFDNDPILNRTFGALISGTEAECVNKNTLQTSDAKRGNLNVYVLTRHPSQPDEWLAAIKQLATGIDSMPFEQRRKRHEKWWAEYWNRSWIYAEENGSSNPLSDNDAFTVSQSYVLQRFINGSAGRGHYPIKFNGSIFTVPSEGKPGNADYRRWGPGYWWQNTRLPYLNMCTAGDFDLIQPLFRMYAEDIYKLSKFRTRKYFGFDGVYFPECMYFWGSVFTSTYGLTPYEEREDKLQESGWHKWEWVAGPELVFMMLDYYDYTLDHDFLRNKIIPVGNDVIRFFDNYYKNGEDGKLVMHPAMACETWWDCTNPMPELSGLHAITKRLLALPAELTGEMNIQFWNAFNASLPQIPLHKTTSGMALAPAERFEVKNNVENPELYAVFPFRLFGLGRPNPEWAVNALKHRLDSGDFGWRQDDIFKAYLGLTEQAKRNLVNRSKNHDQNSRFPAFWGPNYDWTPDQDHGGVLMKTFQSMLIQPDPYSQKIYLTPAWPPDWNSDFKLHAPYNTIIRGKIINGKVRLLDVTPSFRKKDIIIVSKKSGFY